MGNFGNTGSITSYGSTILIGDSNGYGATSFNNNAMVEAINGGTVNVVGSAAPLVAGTLTGGSWEALSSGSLRFGSGITVLAANLLLDGSSSTIYAGPIGTTSALNTLAAIGPSASLTIQDGFNLTDSANGLLNAGLVTVGPGSTLAGASSTFDYIQTAGSTTLNGGALSARIVNIQGGTLAGPGAIVQVQQLIVVGTIPANITVTSANISYLQVGGLTGTVVVSGNLTNGSITTLTGLLQAANATNVSIGTVSGKFLVPETGSGTGDMSNISIGTVTRGGLVSTDPCRP